METTPIIMETIAETMETIAETIPEVLETVPVETIAETIAETILETTPTVIEVIKVSDSAIYAEQLEAIIDLLQTTAEANVLVSGFFLFLVVVLLCYFAYKFLRIFI